MRDIGQKAAFLAVGRLGGFACSRQVSQQRPVLGNQSQVRAKHEEQAERRETAGDDPVAAILGRYRQDRRLRASGHRYNAILGQGFPRIDPTQAIDPRFAPKQACLGRIRRQWRTVPNHRADHLTFVRKASHDLAAQSGQGDAVLFAGRQAFGKRFEDFRSNRDLDDPGEAPGFDDRSGQVDLPVSRCLCLQRFADKKLVCTGRVPVDGELFPIAQIDPMRSPRRVNHHALAVDDRDLRRITFKICSLPLGDARRQLQSVIQAGAYRNQDGVEMPEHRARILGKDLGLTLHAGFCLFEIKLLAARDAQPDAAPQQEQPGDHRPDQQPVCPVEVKGVGLG